MYVLIPLDNEHGLLHPVTSPLSKAGSPSEQLGQAADFVTALVKSGSCKTYELETNQWVFEVRPLDSSRRQWAH